MLKYLSKMAMDMLPSVAATIIGAYVVNHYIITRPAVNAPVAAAVSTTDPTAEAKTEPAKPVSKPSAKSVDVANLPEPGVKAKGISEKALLEKTAAEKPASVDKPVEKPVADKAAADKPAEKAAVDKPADKSTETASVPVEPRRHQPVLREKAVAKGASPQSPVQPFAAPAAAPVVAAPNTAPPVEAAIAPDEHRDAAELARARAARTHPVPPTRPVSCQRLRSRRRRFGRFRRRSWSRRREPRPSTSRRDRHRRGRLTPLTIRVVRSRRPTFHPHCRRRHSICMPTRPTCRRGNTGRSPKTCCRPPSRCFTRYCRNS